jgi:hypothetical protein
MTVANINYDPSLRLGTTILSSSMSDTSIWSVPYDRKTFLVQATGQLTRRSIVTLQHHTLWLDQHYVI